MHAISQNRILKRKADVLVIGAGLAGIIAAISAAEAGAEVCLVSTGQICSGSSFYPGTWGFGLVGPECSEDEENLVETILQVGGQAADRELVNVFVSEINDSIAYLEQMGVPLKKADDPGQREFIPCFDHKGRSWHGIVKEEAKPVFLNRLKELGVVLMPHTEITELLQDDRKEGALGRIRGAVGVTGTNGLQELTEITSRTVILASGGIGGLYQYRLNPGDVTGMGQALALRAGASLINLEFMQMMPGFLKPAYGTVFNEKVFRYTCSPAYRNWTEAERDRLLEIRSGHGPYTSRLESCRVDEAITAEWEQDPEGAWIFYRPEIKENQAEFVKTYFSWLEKEKHLTPDDPVRVGIFAHASNGGIQIDASGFTGVPGLYACGEVTGGMHGADRLGGLSTANGLVFGRRAGSAAAQEAEKEAKNQMPEVGFSSKEKVIKAKEAREIRQKLKIRMQKYGMIKRNEKQCREMLDWLNHMAVKWEQSDDTESSIGDYLETTRLRAERLVAACLMQAILLRKESRGSHHREDYPQTNPAYARMIACSCNDEGISDRWI